MKREFALEVFTGTAAAFHGADLLADARPRVVVCDADSPALVLGSAQKSGVADRAACAQARVDIIKRRSGGGVVLVEPGGMCWFDVVVPAGDARFSGVADDVVASMRWIGGHVRDALAALGVTSTVHGGPMSRGRWDSLVCFAGRGPGEVLDEGGRKLVGISQRRTRSGSRFQCMVHTRWSPGLLRALLVVPRPDIGELDSVGVVAADVAGALPRAVAMALTGSSSARQRP